MIIHEYLEALNTIDNLHIQYTKGKVLMSVYLSDATPSRNDSGLWYIDGKPDIDHLCIALINCLRFKMNELDVAAEVEDVTKKFIRDAIGELDTGDHVLDIYFGYAYCQELSARIDFNGERWRYVRYPGVMQPCKSPLDGWVKILEQHISEHTEELDRKTKLLNSNKRLLDD